MAAIVETASVSAEELAEWAGVGPAIEETRAELEALATTLGKPAPRLVAVSKTKPNAAVLAGVAVGQLAFGENYVAELCEKAPLLPAEIQWHFIGHLQSNKAKPLVEGVPNLFVVESVDSTKLAKKLDNAVKASRPDRPLRVMAQVNTSGEASKSGAEPGDDAVELCRYIDKECENLVLVGLMTIGRYGEDCSDCFECLATNRDRVAEELSITGPGGAALELSMGMSADYVQATQCGSTNVRVGSSIFGSRAYKASSAAADEANAAKAAASAV
mmetsp:Transcript_18278/g.48246  ORF Transcript_18278/g.48246 Transcript_18278/m.48246 type:complete len:273 (-) Transcript_18278:49-867(-)